MTSGCDVCKKWLKKVHPPTSYRRSRCVGEKIGISLSLSHYPCLLLQSRGASVEIWSLAAQLEQSRDELEVVVFRPLKLRKKKVFDMLLCERRKAELWLLNRMHIRAKDYGNDVAIELLFFDVDRFCVHARDELRIQKILAEFQATRNAQDCEGYAGVLYAIGRSIFCCVSLI